MKRWTFLVAMMGLAVWAGAVWAVDYTWTSGAPGNWGTTTVWNPNGVPGQAVDDTASFTSAVGRIVTLNVNPVNALKSFNVTGGGVWTWGVTAVNKLMIGVSNFNYGSSSLSTSVFNSILGGSGGLVVDSGCLNVYNLSNSFAGDIAINGGKLFQGQTGQDPSTNDFGLTTKTIYLGATTAGTNDAALFISDKFSTAVVFYQPIVVRSNNAGKATIGLWNIMSDGCYLNSTVTLQKPVTFLNDLMRAQYVMIDKNRMYMNRGISGDGAVTKQGIGAVSLQASNSYNGATIADGGLFWLIFATNSNTGNITVRKGTLVARGDGSLGNPANTVTLGSPGGLGWLAMNTPLLANGAATNSRSIILDGVGGALFTREGDNPCMDGVISGSGRLFILPTTTAYLNNDNTYSGDTYVLDGTADINGSAKYGKRVYGYSTNVVVNYSGNMVIRSNVNLSAAANVRVESRGRLTLATDYVPTIDTNSAGTLALAVNGGPVFNARMADAGSPLGNGKMTLFLNMDCKFTGTDLSALCGHDPDHTYRVTGTSGGGQGSFLDTATTTGVLKDLLATPYDVSVGAGLRSRDNHGFTGTLKVRGVYWGYLGIGTVSNVMGAVTGPVELYGNDLGNDKLKLIIESGTGSVEARKGDLTFFGSPVVRLDASATAGRTGTVVFASLIRTNRSTLGIYDDQSQLGGRELVKITAAPASTNGMVAPCFWNLRAGTFLDYGANGFVANGWDTNALGSTTPTNKVNLTGGGTVPVGGAEVYALRAGGALLGPDVLTNHSGGLILYNNTVNHTAPLAFGTNEAIVHVISGNTHSLLAPVSGTNGFTKSGYGTLSLLGTNAALYGDITLSDGRLSINNNAGLGSTNNTIVLNGGLLHVNVGATITNNIYLAAGLSGYLGSGSGTVIFRGKISGPGALQCNYWPFGGGENGWQVSNPLNDYTGGTYVYNAFLTVTSTGKLGNGPVYIGSSSGGTVNNPAGGVSSLGDDNFSTNHTLTQGSFSAGLYFNSANPKVGSFEGMGMIVLYAANARLTTGYDNRDTDYFGQIMESPITARAKLVKMGTGRFTLWGENTYSGGTEVSNGTLVVNNWINPVGPVVVRPGATLDGLGTVGVVSNLGGTVKGNLYMRQLVMAAGATNAVTLNGTNAASQYGQLNVSEGVTLDGTLQLTLGFAPAIGQSFTILNNTSGSTISGQFANGTGVTASYGGRTYYFRIDTNGGDGNDVVLTRLVTGTIMTIR